GSFAASAGCGIARVRKVALMSLRNVARIAPLSLLLAASQAAAQGEPPPTAAEGVPAGPKVTGAPIPGTAPANVGKSAAQDSTLGVNAGTPLATGTPGGITAEGAATAAVATSVSAKVDAAKLALAGAQVDAAWDAYFPKLTLTARYTRLSPIIAPN